MSEVTEIIEEVAVQLDIIDTSGGVIEIVGEDATTIEVVELSTETNDLDITTTSTTVIVESNSSGDTTLDITEDSPTTIEVTTSTPIVDVIEKTLISGALEFNFLNLVDRPFNFNKNSFNVGTIGVTSPSYSLHVSGKAFSDNISSSRILTQNITPSGDITSSGNIRAATSVHTKTVTATSGVSASKILSSTSIQLIADNVTLLTATEGSQDSVTIGDGTDVDLQVKTNNDNNAIFVMGDTDRVGIGMNSPTSKLGVTGDLTVSTNITASGDISGSSTSTLHINDITASGAITADIGVQSAAVTRTATDDGSGTGTIASGTSVVLVDADSDANHILILPAPVVGNIIHIIETGTTGYELRSSTPASIGINGGTASNGESAIAGAITYIKCVCVSSTNWICSQFDADGDESKVEAAA